MSMHRTRPRVIPRATRDERGAFSASERKGSALGVVEVSHQSDRAALRPLEFHPVKAFELSPVGIRAPPGVRLTRFVPLAPCSAPQLRWHPEHFLGDCEASEGCAVEPWRVPAGSLLDEGPS